MLKKVLNPIQKFIQIESFSGILLFAVTIIALLWANSGWASSYEAIWQYKMGFTFGDFKLIKPLILWVNDGLMAVFFFLIGLEIKRELLIGELNSLKKATLPLLAAVGGMLAPLALYLTLNTNPQTADGWGITMATDIAFTLAIIKLLGNRVPLSLKIFLTAFAIVDDLGAVLIIAIFYSGGIKWMLVVYALAILAVLIALTKSGKYTKQVTIVAGCVIWLLFLKAGIHPTIAGVLLAFTVPIKNKIESIFFAERVSEIASKIEESETTDTPLLSKTQEKEVKKLKKLIKKYKPRLQHLEHKLHEWSAYAIMPIFALANAGVAVSTDMEVETGLIINIALALLVGKSVGIMLLSYLGVKFKIASLPDETNFTQILGVAILAGVGFTMSIFIANLAFIGNDIYIDSAKIGIILGSILSGVIGYTLLRVTGKAK
ncbi:Na+/H+ antiporter NhaA [Fulvivirga sp. RKSG066]|uniref:Na+/H+ antiporter NhaA n=1 Tax=Fulvivirga aurantia TaxID=2529383 RepID=UPI0012BD483B|nr:Na+/H+ antiporter NhaA [Fulvivirga aurantia]MTI20607.1 Na+/H+ antiporter NhaA [Fulvivirga aurantia]